MEDLIAFGQNKFIYIPLLLWLLIQIYKIIHDLITTKKFNFKRIIRSRGNAKFSFCCCDKYCDNDWKK